MSTSGCNWPSASLCDTRHTPTAALRGAGGFRFEHVTVEAQRGTACACGHTATGRQGGPPVPAHNVIAQGGGGGLTGGHGKPGPASLGTQLPFRAAPVSPLSPDFSASSLSSPHPQCEPGCPPSPAPTEKRRPCKVPPSAPVPKLVKSQALSPAQKEQIVEGWYSGGRGGGRQIWAGRPLLPAAPSDRGRVPTGA